MGDWIALSGSAEPPRGWDGGGLVLALELDLPFRQPVVALDWRRPKDGMALSVMVDPAAGLSVLLRRGRQTLRARLNGAEGLALQGSGLAALGLLPGADGWTLRLVPPSPAAARAMRGRGGVAADAGLVAAIAAAMPPEAAGEGLVRHPAVLWFGIAAGTALPQPEPWIGPATPVDTPSGPCPAARLAPGDIVATLAGPRPLAAVRRVHAPAAGTRAPVCLRAPWFGEGRDLVVSAEQPVRLAGVGVEYLFGRDAVTVLAGHLAGGEAARRDPRPGPVTGVALRLPADPDPGAGVVLADGCVLPVTADTDCLAAVDAVPLRLHLGPGMRARAA